ncbi:MAG: hypothetical protein Q7R58_00020 [bacterium]|nr:hypothetical protein [bacterium]
MLTLKELCSLVDGENPLYGSLVFAFRHLYDDGRLIATRKDAGFFEAVLACKERKLYPVVDQTLRLVLGVKAHDFLMGTLFGYYYHASDPEFKLPHVLEREAADRYITDGYGYFISSMSSGTIIMGKKYRRDRFDEALFASHELDILE